MAVASPGSPRRITLVADELAGLQGGGLGTATAFLGVALARMGHHVDVLYAGVTPARRIDAEWDRLYRESGLRIRSLPPSARRTEPAFFARLRAVDETLCEEPPDVVITQDLAAPAYTALRLRSLGLALQDTLFVVYCHGTRQWITDAARKTRVLPGALVVSVLEQASVELADVAVSPSAYMLDWMRSQQWSVPERNAVIPLITRAAATGERMDKAASGPIARIAFFGRLEERKGVRPFVSALNAIDPELLADLQVEFVGPPTPAWPPQRVEKMISAPAKKALSGVAFITTLDQRRALEHLSRPGTLAVMPSLEDNSPSTVYECIERGIPFLASDAGGTAELVSPSDRDRVLFPPTTDGVARALERTLASRNGFGPAQPAFDTGDPLERWRKIVELSPSPKPSRMEPADDFVLVVPGGDEPDAHLRETLLRAQVASNADVVTCAIRTEGCDHYFLGDPGGLGLLANMYGTVALMRRSLHEQAAKESSWLALARAAATGARIVSVPLPLVRSRRRLATVGNAPTEAFAVARALEKGDRRAVRLSSRLAAGLAADLNEPRAQETTNGVRRWTHGARRLLGRS